MLKQQSEQHTKVPFTHSPLNEKITVAAITWNLFGSLPPPQSVLQLFSSQKLNPLPDIIFIGTQECERSLLASFCCEGKDGWEGLLVDQCKSHYLAVSQKMRGLHIAILLKISLRDYFQMESREKMRAGGPCNIMGNKGAISIQCSVLGQSFQFINCHLAANQEESQRRTETINRVLRQVVRPDENCEVIFLGDFNYRIQMGKTQYGQMITGQTNTQSQMKYTGMLCSDQLRNEVQLKDNFLSRFEEGPITFPPTYKIGVNSQQYHRDRIPGWTDRIFHRKTGKLTRLHYFCEYDVLGSDHRPVVACYERMVQEHAATMSEHMVGVKSGCQLI